MEWNILNNKSTKCNITINNLENQAGLSPFSKKKKNQDELNQI